jgi:hypothetical protein
MCNASGERTAKGIAKALKIVLPLCLHLDNNNEYVRLMFVNFVLGKLEFFEIELWQLLKIPFCPENLTIGKF